MLAVINEKKITEEQVIQLELEELAPEKFDPEIQFIVNKEHADVKRETYFRPLTKEETAALFARGKVVVTAEEHYEPAIYDILPRDVAERLVKEHFEYKNRENKSKKEEDEWVLTKTTELETKTVTKTKPSKSTKA